MAADCSNNSGFDVKCLPWLPRLESLSLAGTELAEVPEELNSKGFENITHLDLSNNRISNLPSWKFAAMPRLQSLNLSHNHIWILPNEACRIPSVDLSYNNLTDMSNLVSIFKTKARITGNPIRCACNSTIARRFFAKPTISSLEAIDCIMPGFEVAKPLATQCNQQYNEEQFPSNGIIPIYLFIFLFIFAVGIFWVCKRDRISVRNLYSR
ncbi:leucine-rich repeat-containing protein 3-like [Drosophila subpulchrella]|uniref:leucine-rich repeat-containing protein 3-like n=1 Tax=Drosophila subpulchrella TaxID=1486046 RepID=UPI0018A1AEBC|nr:leucine-rich repeat-containing protein 3-like [Drosophila subpulchrella]